MGIVFAIVLLCASAAYRSFVRSDQLRRFSEALARCGWKDVRTSWITASFSGNWNGHPAQLRPWGRMPRVRVSRPMPCTLHVSGTDVLSTLNDAFRADPINVAGAPFHLYGDDESAARRLLADPDAAARMQSLLRHGTELMIERNGIDVRFGVARPTPTDIDQACALIAAAERVVGGA